MLGRQIRGSTISILGFGRIGRRFAELLLPHYPSEILYATRHTLSSLEAAILEQKYGFVLENVNNVKELFERADILVITASLNDSTVHIINKESLSWMKSSSMLVNVSRGGLVDESALYQALCNKSLAGAGNGCVTRIFGRNIDIFLINKQ